MARRVEDLLPALNAISGPDGVDPFVVPMPLGNPGDVDVSSLRVAVHTDNGDQTPTGDVQQTVREAARALSDAGASVGDDRPAALHEAFELAYRSFGADGGFFTRRLLRDAGTVEPSRFLADRAGGPPEDGLSLEEYSELLHDVDLVRSELLRFMQQYDAILCPVAAQAAPTHEEAEGLRYSYTSAHNLSGFPGAVVRAGTSPEGMPIGVQVVARPWREDVALALAAVIEDATGGWQPPSI
jgi:amidase